MTDSILDDLFHFSALRAYMEIWAQTRQFPPDLETTRRRAYRPYEEALAEKNRGKGEQHAQREAGQGCEAANEPGIPRNGRPLA